MRTLVNFFLEEREAAGMLGVIVLLVAGVLGACVWFDAHYECVRSHRETQYDPPAYVSVGGGVSVPMGSGSYRDVDVCDEWRAR